MKKHKIFALFITAFMLMFAFAAAAFAAEVDDWQKAADKTAAYLQKTITEPNIGSTGGEWAIIGLARSECDVPQAYFDKYYANVAAFLKANDGKLSSVKYTEYSRVILALTALGADPTNVAGYNLLTPLADYNSTVKQGINGSIWALIALDSADYTLPQNAAAQTQSTRQMYVDTLLARELQSGGWNLSAKDGKGTADPDVTGMVLQALANYQNQPKVKAATDKALTVLSELQEADGGYSSFAAANSESVVQVINALCALGIDINDPRFVKNGHTLADNLLSYQNADGSFRHTSIGKADNLMATEQALYGLVSLIRAANDKPSLYDMTDVELSTGETEKTPADFGLPEKHKDVQKNSLIYPGRTFPDISSHADQAAIEALCERNIINGKGNGLFDPDASMTRAEFAAIVVRALGLEPKTSDTFKDIAKSKWYASFIGTANRYGIVYGKTANTFDPNGTITRQEAACMVARAAKLCGMNTELNETAVQNILAQFGDYKTAADWAAKDLAFCYDAEILDQSDLNIEPKRPILRCEIARMLYNLLAKAELL